MGSKTAKYSDTQLQGFEKSIVAGRSVEQPKQADAEKIQDIVDGMSQKDFNKKWGYKSNNYYYTLKKRIGNSKNNP